MGSSKCLFISSGYGVGLGSKIITSDRNVRPVKRVQTRRNARVVLISALSLDDIDEDDDRLNYVSPLSTRYASRIMRATFSDLTRFRIWRQLWISLAETQVELGMQGVTSEQVEALKSAPDVDIELAVTYERKLRHDVMSHVHAFGDQVPSARGIIHLGATSCYITDNSELLQMRKGLEILIQSLWQSVANLAKFCKEYKDMPTLAYTHFQPAQPTSVGKRASLWLQDFVTDALELEDVMNGLKARGVKGTTGTQASFLSLFDGDHTKVRELDQRVTEKLGFRAGAWSVTGQTYPRKQDFRVVAALAGIGQSAAKMANDVRLLQHMKELEEPFEKSQIGSSAMAYKRNPMRCERINGLARFLQTLLLNPAETASTQWLERTLDDSANRRLAITEAFLSADAILQLVLNVTSGFVVNEKVVAKRLEAELPFMATETILMEATRRGADRQTLHEQIRTHSMEAGAKVKNGEPNILIDLISNDSAFSAVKSELESLCEPSQFIGRAPQQVEEFLDEVVYPLLQERNISLADAVTGEVRI